MLLSAVSILLQSGTVTDWICFEVKGIGNQESSEKREWRKGVLGFGESPSLCASLRSVLVGGGEKTVGRKRLACPVGGKEEGENRRTARIALASRSVAVAASAVCRREEEEEDPGSGIAGRRRDGSAAALQYGSCQEKEWRKRALGFEE